MDRGPPRARLRLVSGLVLALVATGWGAGDASAQASDVPDREPVAVAALKGAGLKNRGLSLEVEVVEDASRYRSRAAFTYEAGPESDVYFVFPGVGDPSRLEVMLDGARIDPARLMVAPHPLYSGDVFRLPPDAGADKPGAHTLVVEGPWQTNEEPYFARWGGWHPYLGDRADPVPIELTVTAPAALRVVASGRRTGEEIGPSTRRSRWRTRNPQGWVFLAVGDYEAATLAEDDATVQVWTSVEGAAVDPGTLTEEPLRVLRYLEETLGPGKIDTLRMVFFPASELRNFSIDGLLVGTSATAVRVAEGSEYLRGFLSHELAHYWFGDLIRTPGAGARWITEGFAEYWRYRYEEAVGADPLPWSYRNQLLLTTFGGRDMPTLLEPAPDTDEALYYQKGSFVLYMLERRLGRDVFDAAMRRFVERYRGQRVRPSDFFAVASEAAGEDLSWFSRQWLDRPRGPVLSAPDVRVRRSEMGFDLDVEVRQAEPAYRIELPLTVLTEDGVEHDFLRSVEDTLAVFTFALEARPVEVFLDPEGRILKWFPPERLPVDFASFREDLATGASLAIRGDPGAWDRVREWISAEFGRVDNGESDSATHWVLLGTRAAEARARLAPSMPGPSEGAIQAWIRRDPEDAEWLIVGIEGTVPDPLPPVIPEAPLSFVVFRDGSVVGAHATGLPALSREVPDG